MICETWRDRVGRVVGGDSVWRGHMFTYGQFIQMYGKSYQNIVSNSPAIKINKQLKNLKRDLIATAYLGNNLTKYQ